MEKEPKQTKDITYFRYPGEANTVAVLMAAKKRCHELGGRKVILASETGRSAISALEIFQGCETRLVVVTHLPGKTGGPLGEIPVGLYAPEYASILHALLEAGVEVIQSRPVDPTSERATARKASTTALVAQTLDLFGAGVKVAIEASLVAADAQAVAEGEEIIACAGTYMGLDTALLISAAKRKNFFQDFEILEYIAKPRSRLKKLPAYEQADWKGSLDKYYA